MERRRYAETEPLLIQGYEEIKPALGEKNPRTLEARDRLTKLYEVTRNRCPAFNFESIAPVR